jgi:hypothetical protein
LFDWNEFSTVEFGNSLSDSSDEFDLLSNVVKRDVFRETSEKILNDFLGTHANKMALKSPEFNAVLPCGRASALTPLSPALRFRAGT